MFGFLTTTATRSRLRSSGFAPSSRLRTEVKPPSLRCAPESGWHRFMFWVLAPAPLDAAPPLSRLPAVRADFLACLDDTPAHDKEQKSLRQAIQRARSLRELWHLRAGLFGFLARHLSQAEADRRLRRLNRHFGGRATFNAVQP